MRLRRDADTGNVDAKYQLGLLYYYGQGVAQDTAVAYRYFKEASEDTPEGHAEAAVNLGIILEAGHGIAKDTAAAFANYRRAGKGGSAEGYFRAGLMLYEDGVAGYDEHERLADAWGLLTMSRGMGHSQAVFYMAVMREYGLHLPQNFTEAGRLYSECCDPGSVSGGGDPDCCYHQALLIAYGRGFSQDYAEAVRILKLCQTVAASSEAWAKAGGATSPGRVHGPCALYLGMLHGAGQGVPVDYQAARVYLQQAADSGDPRATGSARTAFTKLDQLLQDSEAGTKEVLSALAAGMAGGEPLLVPGSQGASSSAGDSEL
jgi:hypothetical protein